MLVREPNPLTTTELAGSNTSPITFLKTKLGGWINVDDEFNSSTLVGINDLPVEITNPMAAIILFRIIQPIDG